MPSHPELISYDCYRAFIRDWLFSSKAEFSKYSLAYVGNHLGVSRMFVKHVLDCKKHFSSEHIPAIVRLLKLKPQESQYFEALHRFNRAKTDREKADTLRGVLKTRSLCAPSHFLGDGDDELFSHWSVIAILQMRDFPEFSSCPHWIQRQLSFKISKTEILNSLHKIEELEKKQKTRLLANMHPIKLPDGFLSVIYRNYAKEVIALGRDAVERQLREERQMFNFAISIPESRFTEAKMMIEDFRHQLHAALGNNGPCQRVIQVNCQLFTLAKQQAEIRHD